MTVFVLDRDGVINYDSEEYVKSPAEWQAIPGSLEAIASLRRAGYKVVVASNQSGVGRGLFDVDTLFSIHQKFIAQLEAIGGSLDGFFFCPHHPDVGCRCRKPQPGMLEDICDRFGVDGKDLIMIGDSTKDLEAVSAVGGRGMLVRTGNGEHTLASLKKSHKTDVFADLAECVGSWLAAHAADD